MKKKLCLILSLCVMLVMSVGSPLIASAAQYDEEVPATWELVCPGANINSFYFKDGQIAYMETADAEEVLTYQNSAIRLRSVDETDTYTVSATFTPSAGQTLAERTYGIVIWYVDPSNFLNFFVQQKSDGGFTFVMYGFVNGQKRAYTLSAEATEWIDPETFDDAGKEFNDYWWDSNNLPTSIRKVKEAIMNQTVTLKAVATTEKHAGLNVDCRKFDLYVSSGTKDVDGASVPDEVKIKSVWVKNTASGNPMTGVYVNKFNVNVDNFEFFSPTAIAKCETLIDSVPAVTAADFASKAVAAAAAYDELGESQAKVNSTKAATLNTAIAAIPSAIDAMLTALNATNPTFANDVANARELYNSLNATLKEKVTKLNLLTAAEDTVEFIVSAAAVIDKIDLIPSAIKLSDETIIKAARTAYNALSTGAKAHVNAEALAKLTNAEASILNLKAAAAFKEKLIAIPSTINEAAVAKVEEARTAYDALSEAQKALITADELKFLTDAEAEVKVLKSNQKDSSGGCGSAIASDDFIGLGGALAATIFGGALLLGILKRKKKA